MRTIRALIPVISTYLILLSPFISFAGWYYLLHDWAVYRVDSSMRTGNRIVGLIERYRHENGQYPASLEDLVPKYTPKIDRPIAGQKLWRYVVEDGNFMLDVYSEGGYPSLYYWSPSGVWYEDS